jgi:membrane fusion protein, multidrug efflux system
MKTMNINRILYPVLLLLFFTLSCKEKEKTEAIIRPVKTIVVGNAEELVRTTFPGVTQEVRSVDLAFRVSGPLIFLNATEGQQVKKGELIAEIDRRDFEIDLLAKEARFEQARAEKERFQRTYERASVSKTEYEQKLAVYMEAMSAFDAAKNALADTRLRAPFDAYIDQNRVENFERVQVGQTIVTLLDLSSIEVRFTIPEILAIQYRQFKDFTVYFDLYRDIPFTADLKEVEKKSEQSAGIPVVLTLRDINDPNSERRIVPGLACKVKVNLKEAASAKIAAQGFAIPISSIYEQPDTDQKFVFVVNRDSLTVMRKEITTGNLVSENMIQVKDGLEAGELLVVAGTNALQNGQKVKILE